MTFEASPAQVRENGRMDVLAELDRGFVEDERDERIVQAGQRTVLEAQRRMWLRRRRTAALCDQLGGTSMFGRHHGEPAALPHVSSRKLR